MYNKNGDKIFDEKFADFMSNSSVSYLRDTDTGTNYYLIRVNKKKTDGTQQFPFVYLPNGVGPGTQSTLTMNKQKGWMLAINGGIADLSGGTMIIHNIGIENGVVIKNTYNYANAMPLTIDGNGDLAAVPYGTDATTLVQNGIVSAICGFFPLVVDFDAVGESVYNWISHYNQQVPRQIIGQFLNGDYAIITCEGRESQYPAVNSNGWTIAQAIAICQKHGLKFAYNLDGGGSTETVIKDKQINYIYENTEGRIVSSYICFNGKDVFEVPNQ